MTTTELRRLFRRVVTKTMDNRGYPAVIGKVDGTVHWTDSNGVLHKDRVWVRLGDGSNPQEMVARCYTVTPQYDLPVTIDDLHGVPTIIGMDVAAALDFTGGRPGANVGAHAWLHNRLGPDPIYITGLQFLPLQARPTSPVSMAVTVEQGSYRWQNVEKIWPTGNSGSFTAFVPTIASINHFVILCLDRATNALVIVNGADIDATDDPYGLMPATLTPADVLAITIADAYYPLAAIVLYNGMDAVRASDIVMDLRLWGGEGGLNGDVTGPASATDNAVVRFDGTTGKLLQNSGVTVNDNGQVGIPGGSTAGALHGGDAQIYRSAANEFTIPDRLIIDSTPGHAELRLKTNNSAGSGTANADLQFYDGTVQGFEFIANFGNTPASNRYGGFIGRADRDGTKLPLRFFTTRTDGNVSGGSIYIEAGMAAGKTGRVSIGANTSPAAMLDVIPDTFASGLNVSPIAIFEARLADGTAGSGGYIGFRQVDAGNSVTTADAARIAAIHEVADLNQGNTGLAFYTSPSAGAATERMRIDRSGRVGIGATAPATSAILEIASTTGAVLLPRMTTTQRDALTAVNGMILYNSTTDKLQGRAAGAWVDLH